MEIVGCEVSEAGSPYALDYGQFTKQNNYIEQILKLRLSGVEIYVDGCECSIYEIKEMLSVCERGTCYMPDYIEDKSTGRIKEIRFDKINLIE